MADASKHWVIRNAEGGLLKYLYATRAIFNVKTDRAFRVYTFAKESTVNKTLKKLEEFGLVGCEAVVVENEFAHEQFNEVQQRKDEQRKLEDQRFEEALSQTDEFTEGYHKYCRVCTRACKLNTNSVFFGRCPQLHVG
jgi:uncharacterized Fe-S radical SAM superfamily protein PflX